MRCVNFTDQFIVDSENENCNMHLPVGNQTEQGVHSDSEVPGDSKVERRYPDREHDRLKYLEDYVTVVKTSKDNQSNDNLYEVNDFEAPKSYEEVTSCVKS